MIEFKKWIVSLMSGSVAAFFGQYGLFLLLVTVAVMLDVVTGIIKSKAIGEGLSSEKARRGFWRKMSLFVGLFFGIFLDCAALHVLNSAGVNIGLEMPFALIVCAYIIINESISVAENLYLTNPDSFPQSIGNMLKVARDKAAGTESEK